MQRNKYLDDLGIDIEEYGVNFCDDEDDDRQEIWAEERKMYGFDSRECWNVDRQYVEWLYSHLMKYLEDAPRVIDIDVDYQTFSFNGKEYTQREAIEYILDNLKEALVGNSCLGDYDEQIRNATLMWAEVFPACWW